MKCQVRVWTTQRRTRDVENGAYYWYVWHVSLIVRVNVMPCPVNRRNSLICTVRTSRQIVLKVQLGQKGQKQLAERLSYNSTFVQSVQRLLARDK